MNTQSIEDSAGKLGDDLQKSARETAETVRTESNKALCCASEKIRNNPIPAVVGAMAFGIAIGCLIMSGRQTPTLQDRYIKAPLDDASAVLTKVSESLGSLASNLKFW